MPQPRRLPFSEARTYKYTISRFSGPHIDCHCPLASKNCERQSENRKAWLNAIKKDMVYVMQGLVEEAKEDPHIISEYMMLRDDKTMTPLQIATNRGNMEAFKYLLSILPMTVDPVKVVNLQDFKREMCPLMEACQSGSLEMATLLSEAGAKWHLLTHDKVLAKDFAVKGGHLEIAELARLQEYEKEQREAKQRELERELAGGGGGF